MAISDELGGVGAAVNELGGAIGKLGAIAGTMAPQVQKCLSFSDAQKSIMEYKKSLYDTTRALEASGMSFSKVSAQVSQLSKEFKAYDGALKLVRSSIQDAANMMNTMYSSLGGIIAYANQGAKGLSTMGAEMQKVFRGDAQAMTQNFLKMIGDMPNMQDVLTGKVDPKTGQKKSASRNDLMMIANTYGIEMMQAVRKFGSALDPVLEKTQMINDAVVDLKKNLENQKLNIQIENESQVLGFIKSVKAAGNAGLSIVGGGMATVKAVTGPVTAGVFAGAIGPAMAIAKLPAVFIAVGNAMRALQNAINANTTAVNRNTGVSGGPGGMGQAAGGPDSIAQGIGGQFGAWKDRRSAALTNLRNAQGIGGKFNALGGMQAISAVGGAAMGAYSFFQGQGEALKERAHDKGELSTWQKVSTVGGSALAGAAFGAMIGSAVPVIGTAIGAVAGAVIGGVMGAFQVSKAGEEAKKALGELTKSFNEGAKSLAKMSSRASQNWDAMSTQDRQTALNKYDEGVGIQFNNKRERMSRGGTKWALVGEDIANGTTLNSTAEQRAMFKASQARGKGDMRPMRAITGTPGSVMNGIDSKKIEDDIAAMNRITAVKMPILASRTNQLAAEMQIAQMGGGSSYAPLSSDEKLLYGRSGLSNNPTSGGQIAGTWGQQLKTNQAMVATYKETLTQLNQQLTVVQSQGNAVEMARIRDQITQTTLQIAQGIKQGVDIGIERTMTLLQSGAAIAGSKAEFATLNHPGGWMGDVRNNAAPGASIKTQLETQISGIRAMQEERRKWIADPLKYNKTEKDVAQARVEVAAGNVEIEQKKREVISLQYKMKQQMFELDKTIRSYQMSADMEIGMSYKKELQYKDSIIEADTKNLEQIKLEYEARKKSNTLSYSEELDFLGKIEQKTADIKKARFELAMTPITQQREGIATLKTSVDMAITLQEVLHRPLTEQMPNYLAKAQLQLKDIEQTKKEIALIDKNGVDAQGKMNKAMQALNGQVSEYAKTLDYVRNTWEQTITEQAVNLDSGSYILPGTSSTWQTRGSGYMPGRNQMFAPTATGGGMGSYEYLHSDFMSRGLGQLDQVGLPQMMNDYVTKQESIGGEFANSVHEFAGIIKQMPAHFGQLNGFGGGGMTGKAGNNALQAITENALRDGGQQGVLIVAQPGEMVVNPKKLGHFADGGIVGSPEQARKRINEINKTLKNEQTEGPGTNWWTHIKRHIAGAMNSIRNFGADLDNAVGAHEKYTLYDDTYVKLDAKRIKLKAEKASLVNSLIPRTQQYVPWSPPSPSSTSGRGGKYSTASSSYFSVPGAMSNDLYHTAKARAMASAPAYSVPAYSAPILSDTLREDVMGLTPIGGSSVHTGMSMAQYEAGNQPGWLAARERMSRGRRSIRETSRGEMAGIDPRAIIGRGGLARGGHAMAAIISQLAGDTSAIQSATPGSPTVGPVSTRDQRMRSKYENELSGRGGYTTSTYAGGVSDRNAIPVTDNHGNSIGRLEINSGALQAIVGKTSRNEPL